MLPVTDQTSVIFYVAFYLFSFSDFSSSVVYFDHLFVCSVVVYSDQLLGARHTLLYFITISTVNISVKASNSITEWANLVSGFEPLSGPFLRFIINTECFRVGTALKSWSKYTTGGKTYYFNNAEMNEKSKYKLQIFLSYHSNDFISNSKFNLNLKI